MGYINLAYDIALKIAFYNLLDGEERIDCIEHNNKRLVNHTLRNGYETVSGECICKEALEASLQEGFERTYKEIEKLKAKGKIWVRSFPHIVEGEIDGINRRTIRCRILTEV